MSGGQGREEDTWAPYLYPNPDHPERPSHRDFDWLSAIVMDLDTEAEELPKGSTIDDIAKRYVDSQSLAYMAFQRAVRVLMAHGFSTSDLVHPERQREIIRMAAIYYDGFILGVRFERQRAKRDRKSGNPGKRSQ